MKNAVENIPRRSIATRIVYKRRGGAHGGGLFIPSPGHASSCCGCQGCRCEEGIQVVGEQNSDHQTNLQSDK